MNTSDPFCVVADFEAALAEYTGARYAVTVSSCTAALFLSFLWWAKKYGSQILEMPSHTYASVPMVAIQAGHRVKLAPDWEWPEGYYRVMKTAIWDAAPIFRPGMYVPDRGYAPTGFVCISFHPRKPLGLSTGGGAILHDDMAADEWFRRMRFDGRRPGVSIHDDAVCEIGYHYYMMPAAAAEGLHRLSVYRPGPVVVDDYPDLSRKPVFREHPGVVR